MLRGETNEQRAIGNEHQPITISKQGMNLYLPGQLPISNSIREH